MITRVKTKARWQQGLRWHKDDNKGQNEKKMTTSFKMRKRWQQGLKRKKDDSKF